MPRTALLLLPATRTVLVQYLVAGALDDFTSVGYECPVRSILKSKVREFENCTSICAEVQIRVSGGS